MSYKPAHENVEMDASLNYRQVIDECYVIVRPLSAVEYTSVDRGLTDLIHDRCSCSLFTLSSVSSSACLFHAWKVSNRREFYCCYYLYSRCQLGWMCPLKHEQARRERESDLRLVNSL